jgi:WD repeat-containing protein 19
VIECQRAGLKVSAFEYASTLMRQEYRSEIEPKLKRKIEGLVRRPAKDQAQDDVTDDPVSGQPLAAHDLVSPATRDVLPYCIVTGQHMTLDAWAKCPNCSFPALLEPFKAYLHAHDSVCPMCSEAVNMAMVQRLPDPKPQLQRWLRGGVEAKAEEKEEEEGGGDGSGVPAQ